MPSTSEPAYSVHADLDVMIEARDGTGLATDIYRPADPDTREPIEEPRPVILDRTPYDKTGGRTRHGEWYASRGYVIAIQDVRGRFDSEGEFFINKNEAEDGADTVEWLADQEFCDGNVVTRHVLRCVGAERARHAGPRRPRRDVRQHGRRQRPEEDVPPQRRLRAAVAVVGADARRRVLPRVPRRPRRPAGVRGRGRPRGVRERPHPAGANRRSRSCPSTRTGRSRS